jgi:hypothetical protein
VQDVVSEVLGPARRVLQCGSTTRCCETHTEPEVLDHSTIVGNHRKGLAAGTSGQT